MEPQKPKQKRRPNKKRERQWWTVHPNFQPGAWHAELAGLIPHYPKTQEAFDKKQAQCREQIIRLNAEGRAGRRGVPDGWAGRKKELYAIRAKAAVKAKAIVKEMTEKELLTVDGERAEIAMTAAVEIIVAQDNKGTHVYTTKDRMDAIKTVLKHTKPLPAIKAEVKLSPAEQFLSFVAGELAKPE